MTHLTRVKTVLSGFPGGPGVATMYALDTATFVDALHTLWTRFAASMPNDVHVQVEHSGDIIEDTTGAIVGQWDFGAAAPIVGSDQTGYAGPAGVVVRWTTANIANGKRVRGRTFVVPLGSDNYQSNGSVTQGTVDGFSTAAQAFRESQHDSFVVWHRPRAHRAAVGKLKELPATLGSNALVTGHSVPSRVAILRSRRG